jgi:hypothetical protein
LEAPGRKYIAGVDTAGGFWARRLRWRLIGAWRWPLFLVLTLVDALIVVWRPPSGREALFVPALVICSFANLFLIGAIAPWLARRTVARQGQRPASPSFPPANHLELVTDRIASAVLVLGAVGLLATGLASGKPRVCVTDRACHVGDAAVAFVNAHAPAEIRRNIDTANSYRLGDAGLFRVCVEFDDRRRAYCMFVDASKKPISVRPDPDSRPNGAVFRNP